MENIIAELEKRRAAIERALESLRGIEGAAPAKRRGRPPRKKKFSAEARQRMSEAQKRRYAEKRAVDGAGAKKRAGRRHISAESRARMAEAARQMWAAKKAAAK